MLEFLGYSMAEAQIQQSIFHDITHFGVRLSIGVIFIAHSIGKFEPGFGGFVTSLGLPAEMQIPIALAELIPGILLIIGVLTRISAALLSVIMIGAIFIVKGATSLTGDGGVEYDVILLAASLVIVAIGPGRISLSHIIKKVPRLVQ